MTLSVTDANIIPSANICNFNLVPESRHFIPMAANPRDNTVKEIRHTAALLMVSVHIYGFVFTLEDGGDDDCDDWTLLDQDRFIND